MTLIKTFSYLIFAIAALISAAAYTDEPQAAPASNAITFVPPDGWKAAENGQLSPRVKMMCVGTSDKGFPPSLNLAVEQYEGTLAQYLKIVKSINDAKGSSWRNLGSITTEAGVGNLSQVDAKTQYGPLRMMHVILLKEGVVYILTAAALADEFPALYQDFFKSFRSLSISKQAN